MITMRFLALGFCASTASALLERTKAGDASPLNTHQEQYLGTYRS